MLENWARSEALALYWNDEAGLCQYVAKSCFSLVPLYPWIGSKVQGSGVQGLWLLAAFFCLSNYI
jgi:hypothetical protein